jgi:hypothetical protein
VPGGGGDAGESAEEGDFPGEWIGGGLRSEGGGFEVGLVGAFGDGDAEEFGSAGAFVVAGEAEAEFGGFDADGGVDAGVVVGGLAIYGESDDGLLDFVAAAGERFLDDEAQEALLAVGGGEFGGIEDALEVVKDGLGLGAVGRRGKIGEFVESGEGGTGPIGVGRVGARGVGMVNEAGGVAPFFAVPGSTPEEV